MAPPRIYLDHAATTPLRPQARAAMADGFGRWANPSSPHAEGRAARRALEEARARLKALLGWDGEVILTAGASEAAALAIGRVRADTRFVAATEHDAVLRAADGADGGSQRVPVGSDGALDLGRLDAMLGQGGRPLVAIQAINSETGNAQPLSAIAARVRAAGGLLLVDCSQSAGKRALPPCDMAIVSAHKFGGPIGVGALLVRDYAMLEAAGGQERGYRHGTENLPGVLGMAAALEACADPYLAPQVLDPLEPFADAVRACGGTWFPDRLADPTPCVLALAMPNLPAAAQLMRFDMAGIAVSQGSACSSGTMKRSPMLAAMGVAPELADRTIRVSFGWTTTRVEVERFCAVWLELAHG